MGAFSWSPLAGGWLSGRFVRGCENTTQRKQRLPARAVRTSCRDLHAPVNQTKLKLMTELGKLAEQARLSMHELAIGFVLEHSIIGSVMIDPRTCKQLNNQIQSAATRLTTDVVDRIDEITSPGVDINPDNRAGPPLPLTAARLRHRSSTTIRR